MQQLPLRDEDRMPRNGWYHGRVRVVLDEEYGHGIELPNHRSPTAAFMETNQSTRALR